jgi:AAA family ATPase
LGDLCEVIAEDGTTLGAAIAWRAADKMGSGNPKTKPVKVSEIAKEALGLLDGNQITLRKADFGLSRASKVVLRDVTQSDQVIHRDESENDQWRWQCGYALCNADALALGISFDLTVKKGLKKRFRVDGVQGASIGCNLYSFNGRTTLTFANPASSPSPEPGMLKTGPLFDLDRVGALVDQCHALNRRIELATEAIRTQKDLEDNEGVLLHGFQGTGKSYLLAQLEQAPARKVFRLDEELLASSTTSKKCDTTREVFRLAAANQPSLVLIDDIHKLAPLSEDIYTRVLAKELDTSGRSGVLVVATCRSPGEVNEALLKPGRFSHLVELPVPDRNARYQILKSMLDSRETLVREVASTTHGYTVEDLELLRLEAKRVADLRSHRVRINATISVVNGDSQPGDKNHVNGDSQPRDQIQASVTNGETLTSDLILEDIEIALRKMRPTALREVFFEPPNIGWADIGGSDDIKKRFDKTLGRPLNHADKMAEWHIRPSKGVLLYGPPGCSKTLTAQAVASHYGLNFITVKGAELISMYVGESERAVREIFRKARQAAPCVIFFDEIDSIASERDSGNSKGLNVLTTLLNEMDGFDTLNGVFILAATNKPWVLDPAIMRPGRFGSHIYLGPPDAAARMEIFELKLRGLPVENGFQLDSLIEQTEGRSGEYN